MATNQDLNPSAISVFQFKSNEVRAINRDGVIWFVASDVAAVLSYRDAANMARILDDDEKGTHIVSTLGGEQEQLIINESGLYHAVLKSRKPEAKPFRKWVTAEVLPAIRKTGSYTLPRATISPEQKAALHAIVDRRVNGFDSLRAGVWKRHNRHFNINSYHELLAARFEDATAYLETLEVKYPQVKADEAPKALPSPECESALKLIESIKAAPVIAGLVDCRITRKALGGLIDCLELHQPSSQVEPALAVLKAVDQLMMRQHTVITECEFLAGGQGKACHPTTMNNLRRTLKLGTSLSVSVLH